MTLEEIIAYERGLVIEYGKAYQNKKGSNAAECLKKYDYHKSIVKWLEEYKKYKEDYKICE